jgi:eukaryotic-like serine/threonine-protein kinase
MTDRRMQPCPNDQTIDALLSGLSPPAERDALAEHIDSCRTCQLVVARLSMRFSQAGRVAETTTTLGPTSGGAAGAAGLSRGDRIGRYVILGAAGQGGMGAVFAAFDTLLERKVALKFLTRHRSDEAALARVLAEAGTMARLSHPNVVTVHDVGLHDGLAFLSMELVDGTTLAKWRGEARRSHRDVARVMAAVARGLAAAHAAGIVHRDVKPQNVLVAGTRVLVTDFGLSVRSDQLAEGESEGKGDGKIVGTPAYMAPEQHRGDPVDARTDMFGFCATLYQMLHGQPPFTGTSIAALRAQVLAGQVAPPPAGSRVPARLHRLALQGMDPEPARRPADMNRVAEALLADPGASRRAFGAVAVAALATVGAFWVGSYLTGNPERQCRVGADAMDRTVWTAALRAGLRRRYQQADKLASWPVLERRLDQYADSWRAMYTDACADTYGQRVQSDQVFDLRVQCLEAQRGSVQAFVGALGAATPPQLVVAAGAVLPAVTDCESSGRLETRPLPVDPAARAQLAGIEKSVAQALADENLGRYAKAGVAAEQAVAAARKLGYEPVLATALVRLAAVEYRKGASPDKPEDSGVPRAARLLEEAYAAAENGRDDRQRLTAAREQVMTQVHLSQYDRAQFWVRLAEALQARLGNPPAEAAQLAKNIGWVKYMRGDPKGAEASFGRALELGKKLKPADDRLVAASAGGLCIVKSNLTEKIACYRKAVGFATAAFGPEHPELGNYLNNMANALEQKDESRAEACELRRRVLALKRGQQAPNHPDMIMAVVNLSTCLNDDGQVAEARRLLEQDAIALELGLQEQALAYEAYGHLLKYRAGDLEGGLTYYRKTIAAYEKVFGVTHYDALRVRTNLSMMLADGGRPAEALREAEAAIAIVEQAGVTNIQLAELYVQRGVLLEKDKKFDAAVAAYTKALELHKQLKSPEAETATSLYGLGSIELKQGRVAQAVVNLGRALELQAPGEGLWPERRARTAMALAQALLRQGPSRARACELAREAAAIFKKTGKHETSAAEATRWLAAQRCGPEA